MAAQQQDDEHIHVQGQGTAGTAMKRRGILAAAAAVAAGIVAKQTSQPVAASTAMLLANTETVGVSNAVAGPSRITANSGYTATGAILVVDRSGAQPLAAHASLHGAVSIPTDAPEFCGVYGQGGGATGVLGDAGSYFGVHGISDTGIGVVGDVKAGGVGTSNIAVLGRIGGIVPNGQNNTTAVYAQNLATGTGSIGMQGIATTGIGASLQGGQAPLRLVPGTAAAANLAAAGHQAGELYVTSDDRLMFFTGVAWRELAFVPPNPTPAAQPTAQVQPSAPAPLPTAQATTTTPGAPNPLPPVRP